MLAMSLLPAASISAEVDKPQIRGLDIDPVSIESDEYLFEKEQVEPIEEFDQTASLNGGVTQLAGVVGKSQFIRFDEKVKRISITNPELADLILLSPKEMILNGKAAGETSLILWGESNEPIFFDLMVKVDSKAFVNAVNKIAPDEEIQMDFTSNSVVITGSVSSTDLKAKIANLAKAYALELVDLAESPTNQVVLEVKIVEASKAVQKTLSSTFSDSNAVGIGTNTKGVSFDGTMSGFKFFSYKPTSDFQLDLMAAEQKGKVRILAEPKLLTANGKQASFNSGQEVPIPSGVGQGGNVGYEYKSIGVNVSFTPQILIKSRRVMLEVAPEVSEIDSTATVAQSGGGTALGFKTRSVNTTVELADGETLVIAGLYKKTDNETDTLVPILGDIPIIGKLFKNSDYRKDDTELMIFVTPRIVEAKNSNIDRI